MVAVSHYRFHSSLPLVTHMVQIYKSYANPRIANTDPHIRQIGMKFAYWHHLRAER